MDRRAITPRVREDGVEKEEERAVFVVLSFSAQILSHDFVRDMMFGGVINTRNRLGGPPGDCQRTFPHNRICCEGTFCPS